jgi:hypothetical protein
MQAQSTMRRGAGLANGNDGEQLKRNRAARGEKENRKFQFTNVDTDRRNRVTNVRLSNTVKK